MSGSRIFCTFIRTHRRHETTTGMMAVTAASPEKRINHRKINAGRANRCWEKRSVMARGNVTPLLGLLESGVGRIW
ncbi:hypothetical protein HN51_001074 [Arachis hypogaea]